MKINTLRVLACASVFGLVAFSVTAAQAALMVDAKFNSVSPSRDVQITITDTYYAPSQTKTETTRAGKFNWTGTSSSNPGITVGDFVTFCCDFNQNISYGSTYSYNYEPLGNAPRPNNPGSGNPTGGSAANNGLGTGRTQETLIRQLFAAFFPSLGSDADKNAAFQVTIWKILYETNPLGYTNITAGNFQLTGGSASAAYAGIVNSNLSFLLGNPTAPQADWVAAITSNAQQDQIVVLVPPSDYPRLVPEPGALGLIAPAGMLLARRRR